MSAVAPTQLILGISLGEETGFDNFLITESNRELVATLCQETAGPQFIFVRSARGSGLSHLLQAVCHHESEAGRAAIYLPMADRQHFAPAIFEGVSQLATVCIDDVDAMAGDAAWERSLFNAFNEIHAGTTRLVIGAHCGPGDIGFELPDLASRLQLAPVFQMRSMGDEEKRELLQLRAHTRGMRLADSVADYILARTERSPEALMQVLDKLDSSSLSRRRALTVPLVKDTMDW